MRRKTIFSIITYALCGFFVIAFVFAVDWKKACLVVGSMPFFSLVLYCLIVVSTFFIGWCRYKVIIGGTLNWKTTGYIYFLSKAGGSLTPARIGDFIPMVYKEFRTGEIFSVIIIDKVLELYCMFFFGCIGLLGMKNLPVSATVAVGGGFILITAAFILLSNSSLWVLWLNIFQKYQCAARNQVVRCFIGAICKLLSFSQKASAAVKRLGWKYLILIGLAFGSYMVSLVAAKILFNACSITISLFLILELMTVSGLIMIFSFIPGGLGVSEITLLFILSFYGISRESFAAYAVISRCVTIVIPIVLYSIFVFMNYKTFKPNGHSMKSK